MHEIAGRPRESTGKVTQLIELVFLSDTASQGSFHPCRGLWASQEPTTSPFLANFLNPHSQDSYASQILPVTEE